MSGNSDRRAGTHLTMMAVPANIQPPGRPARRGDEGVEPPATLTSSVLLPPAQVPTESAVPRTRGPASRDTTRPSGRDQQRPSLLSAASPRQQRPDININNLHYRFSTCLHTNVDVTPQPSPLAIGSSPLVALEKIHDCNPDTLVCGSSQPHRILLPAGP